MKQYTLPSRTLFLWRIRLFAVAGVLTLLLCWLCYIVPVQFVLLFLAVLWVVAFFIGFWYLPRQHRNYKITLNEQSLLLQRGVFLHTHYLMPAPRMIYAELLSTPLCRSMGLCGLSLRAARGILHIAPLELKEAMEILMQLDREEDRL